MSGIMKSVEKTISYKWLLLLIEQMNTHNILVKYSRFYGRNLNVLDVSIHDCLVKVAMDELVLGSYYEKDNDYNEITIGFQKEESFDDSYKDIDIKISYISNSIPSNIANKVQKVHIDINDEFHRNEFNFPCTWNDFDNLFEKARNLSLIPDKKEQNGCPFCGDYTFNNAVCPDCANNID